MHDLDEIERAINEFDHGIVSHSYLKTLVAYARRALRVERGMEKHAIDLNYIMPRLWDAVGIHEKTSNHDTPFAAVLALLDKLEPQTEGSGR